MVEVISTVVNIMLGMSIGMLLGAVIWENSQENYITD